MGEGTPEVTATAIYHLYARPVRPADARAWARLPWPLRVDVEARFPFPPRREFTRRSDRRRWYARCQAQKGRAASIVAGLRVLRLLPLIVGLGKSQRTKAACGLVQLDIQADGWRVVWSAEDGAEAHSAWLPVRHLEVTFAEVQTFIRGPH